MKRLGKAALLFAVAFLVIVSAFPFAPVAAHADPADSGAATASPAAAILPCDFMTADFMGKDAAVLETLLCGWGFQYYKPDGKWTGEDAYELALFQRWAKLAPTGAVDQAVRNALLSTYLVYGEAVIPRQKLPLEGKYIGINAGHQQKADYAREPLSPEAHSPLKSKVSSGTQGVVTRVPEYKVTLAVALKLRSRLEAQGARVLMVRTTDAVRIGNAERAKMMNAAGVDASVSLHCDGSRNRTVNGLHTLIPADRGYQHGPVLKMSQRLANDMQTEEIKATGARNKGFSTRRDLSGFNWSKVPTCLIEMGFMTYPAEDRRLVTAAYQDKLAIGIANGFLRYFKEIG